MAVRSYVRPARGGWSVLKEGHRRGAVKTATKKEAIAEARKLVRGQGGGEVRVMNAKGKITDANTVEASAPRAVHRAGKRSAR